MSAPIPDGYTLGIPPSSGIYLTQVASVDRQHWYDYQRCMWAIASYGGWYTNRLNEGAPSEARQDDNTSGVWRRNDTGVCWRLPEET